MAMKNVQNKELSLIVSAELGKKIAALAREKKLKVDDLLINVLEEATKGVVLPEPKKKA